MVNCFWDVHLLFGHGWALELVRFESQDTQRRIASTDRVKSSGCYRKSTGNAFNQQSVLHVHPLKSVVLSWFPCIAIVETGDIPLTTE